MTEEEALVSPVTVKEKMKVRQSIVGVQRRVSIMNNLVETEHSGGHLFAAEADLRKLACDAWLLPTNKDKVVLPIWTQGQEEHHGSNNNPTLSAIARGDFSAYNFPTNWGPEARSATLKKWEKGSMPILTITGGEPNVPEQETLDWYVDAVQHFVEAYMANPVRNLPFRAKPLLAVPLVGIGRGGGMDRTTLLLEFMSARCAELALKHNVDIVVTIVTAQLFAIFQYCRRQANLAWPTLQGQRLQVAKSLANKVLKGELVLFLGAGVSMGAGLPSWGQLLDKLCESAGITPEKKKMLQTLDYLDYAQVLKEDLKHKGFDINAEVAKLINSPTYALTHALLATWRVANTVTQNYDDMYEKASADSSASHLAVIPYKFDSGSERWLLKMHGCVNNSADIVLTREDYQYYNVHREALSGVVQTLMMTKHMLILGFSMTDEHFIDLAFTLRKAVGGMERDSTLGTVVMLKSQIRSGLNCGTMTCRSLPPVQMKRRRLLKLQGIWKSS